MGETTKVMKKSFSFDGWELWRFIKGRKKTAVTVVGFIIGLKIGDSSTVAIASAGVVEAAFAVGEYYFKKYEEKL